MRLVAVDDLLEIGYELGDSVTAMGGERAQMVLLPSETEVEDLRELEQLRDMVYGYQNQNCFLNREVLGESNWHC